MGASESKYRITRTDAPNSPWTGFCAVVTIDEIGQELCMPNGEKHRFIFINDKGLRIVEGPHKGYYDLQIVY